MSTASSTWTSAEAAVRSACDAVDDGLLSVEQALLTIDAGSLEDLLHPTLDPGAPFDVLVGGEGASPGAAKGAVVFTAADAVAAAEQGRDVILMRSFAAPDDVPGFAAARGIVTSEGGRSCHAALVARGMGRPWVCGGSAIEIDVAARVARIGDREVREGDLVTIDGSAGIVTLADVPLIAPTMSDAFRRVLDWADEHRRLDVRANADMPEDARRARELGAAGIGLCRTEHMFMASDRLPRMRAMILADGDEARRAALDELLPMQQADFEGLFSAMEGLPVTIRLLDPPLHEFLPHGDAVPARLREANPMLGTRGIRLGLLHPEIYAMQVEAIFRAAVAVRRRDGRSPLVEIMVPLVVYEGELARARALVTSAAELHGLREGVDYAIGATIELPHSCLVADRIAESAAFLSFGTNDLTQTAMGLSRDDAEGRFLPLYLREGIIARSPFETIDERGVGRLIRMAVQQARAARPEVRLGVCGEHGGDPDSISFFDAAGLDYVSCSPFRVPIARVAAAQAALSVTPNERTAP
jgi:pyruvate,orthophosphate dikinase